MLYIYPDATDGTQLGSKIVQLGLDENPVTKQIGTQSVAQFGGNWDQCDVLFEMCVNVCVSWQKVHRCKMVQNHFFSSS